MYFYSEKLEHEILSIYVLFIQQTGEIELKNWYTRQEVADILGISKATVYHYAKQKKIIKIANPHRLIREVRYKLEEVDALAIERQRHQPMGLRPSALAKQLGVTPQRIYALIRETNLPVDELPVGDERTIYSIPDETAAWIRQEIERTASARGTRVEYYDAKFDIVLYQCFVHNKGKICVYCETTTRSGDSICNHGHGFLLRTAFMPISMRQLIQSISRIGE